MSGTRFFPLRGESDDPVSGKPMGYAGLWSSAALFGLLWGLGVFILAGTFMGIDYFSVRNHPTEIVTIVSVEPSGTQEICGRALTPNTPGERTTYLSASPPDGLPAEFAITHCPWEEAPGSTLQVRRTGTSADEFYPDPIESPSQWLGTAGTIGLGAAVAMMCVGLLNGVWEVRAERRAQRRRPGREESIDTRPDPSADQSASE